MLRRRRVEAQKLQEVAAMVSIERSSTSEPDPYAGVYRDEQLQLVFTCCHPALPLAGRVALTLKTVAGLSTAQIARAFLVSEATMGQRLLRTRNKIAHTGIRLQVPEPHRLAERTAGVFAVIYLIFTEGYAAPDSEDAADLAAEAIRLAELLTRLLPQDAEARGLQALLLLQHARHAARTDHEGDLIPMEEQDRSRWDHTMIAAGLSTLDAARDHRRSARSVSPPSRDRRSACSRADRGRYGLDESDRRLRRPTAAASVARRRLEPRSRGGASRRARSRPGPAGATPQ